MKDGMTINELAEMIGITIDDGEENLREYRDERIEEIVSFILEFKDDFNNKFRDTDTFWDVLTDQIRKKFN